MVTRINLATSWEHPRFQYFGLSTDNKPADAVENSGFTEIDTGCEYYYANGAWHVATNTGSGSSTSTISISGSFVTYTVATTDGNTDIVSADVYGFNVIPRYLFKEEYKLASVNFTGSPRLSAIMQYAFYGCSNLVFASFPNTLQTISEFAFANCPKITELTFHNGITQIDNHAFYNCENLKSVIFKGTPTLAASIFSNCTKLTNIYVPWSEGAVANAPWGAPNATVHYDWSE